MSIVAHEVNTELCNKGLRTRLSNQSPARILHLAEMPTAACEDRLILGHDDLQDVTVKLSEFCFLTPSSMQRRQPTDSRVKLEFAEFSKLMSQEEQVKWIMCTMQY